MKSMLFFFLTIAVSITALADTYWSTTDLGMGAIVTKVKTQNFLKIFRISSDKLYGILHNSDKKLYELWVINPYSGGSALIRNLDEIGPGTTLIPENCYLTEGLLHLTTTYP